MRYLYVDFEGYQYWIEVNDSNFALRQVTIDGKNNVEVSCRQPCLADQLVDTQDDWEIINASDFEAAWLQYTLPYRQNWDDQKERFPVGLPIAASIQYFYPQGVILDLGSVQGCAVGDYQHRGSLAPGDEICGIVSGYDEENMWVLVG